MIMQGMAARRVQIACVVGMRAVAIGAGLSMLAFSQAAPRLTINPTPVFGVNTSPDAGLTIEVDNYGPDARGTVTIMSSGGSTVYPIELPRGAHKRFIAYPLTATQTSYEPVSCDLDTDRGSVHSEVDERPDDESRLPSLEI